jgi:hypothetical protein
MNHDMNKGNVRTPAAASGAGSQMEANASAASSPLKPETSDKERAPEREEKPEVAGPGPQRTEMRSLGVVIRAYARHHVRSLMFKRLADLALQEFRGVEGHPPTKLFRMPDGSRFQVDPDDSLEVSMDLYSLANEERLRMNEIREAAVHIAPAAVDIPAVPYVPSVPAEDDGDAVDNPAFKVVTASPVPKHVANGVARAAKPATPDEWTQAVGASNGAGKT